MPVIEPKPLHESSQNQLLLTATSCFCKGSHQKKKNCKKKTRKPNTCQTAFAHFFLRCLRRCICFMHLVLKNMRLLSFFNGICLKKLSVHQAHLKAQALYPGCFSSKGRKTVCFQKSINTIIFGVITLFRTTSLRPDVRRKNH